MGHEPTNQALIRQLNEDVGLVWPGHPFDSAAHAHVPVWCGIAPVEESAILPRDYCLKGERW